MATVIEKTDKCLGRPDMSCETWGRRTKRSTSTEPAMTMTMPMRMPERSGLQPPHASGNRERRSMSRAQICAESGFPLLQGVCQTQCQRQCRCEAETATRECFPCWELERLRRRPRQENGMQTVECIAWPGTSMERTAVACLGCWRRIQTAETSRRLPSGPGLPNARVLSVDGGTGFHAAAAAT